MASLASQATCSKLCHVYQGQILYLKPITQARYSLPWDGPEVCLSHCSPFSAYSLFSIVISYRSE